MALSREAAARSVSNAPPVHHMLEVQAAVPDGGSVAIPWIGLEGRVGTADLFETDTVIALDMSVSTHFPSGLDLDQDGVVGEVRGVVRAVGGYDPTRVDQGAAPPVPPGQWTTDADDSIAALELAAGRAIISGLAQRKNRVGLITYVDRARVRREVGNAADAVAALDDVRPSVGPQGTDIYAALRRARQMLDDAPPMPGFPRQRAVMLFSDGRPIEPVNPYIARIRAKEAALDLEEAGIDLYVFSLGDIGVEQAKFLIQLAGSGAGRLYRVGAPERMLDDLPPIDLTPNWLRIENATTGEAARGVQARSDGHFDAFVPLQPGENRVRVLAELGNGKLQRWEARVVLEPGDGETPEQRAATERVLRLIAQREGGEVSVEAARDAAAGPPHPASDGVKDSAPE